MKRVHAIGNTFLYFVAVVFALLCVSLLSSRVFAAGETFTGGNDKTGLTNEEITIDDLQISGTGNDVLSINIHAPSGSIMMTDVEDLISYSEGRIITASGTRSALNDALASLVFVNDDYGTTTITASIVQQDEDAYNPENGHVYRIVEADGEGVNWSEAKSAAESTTYGELPGYLATLTHEEESLLILHNLTSDAWVGGTDDPTETDDQEGEWYWSTEPGSPIHFWSGDETGEPVDEDLFINWETNVQPDNDGGGENCLELVFAQAGLWNDVVCTNTQSRYVVEFGANGSNPDVPTKQFTITTSGPTVEVDSCEELRAIDDDGGVVMMTINITDDIDCSGSSFTPLFSEDYFLGTVNGNGHTISNVMIDEGSYNAGLFAAVMGLTVNDLNLEDFTVIGEDRTGALAGYIENNVALNNVHARNIEVVGTSSGYVGGLIGELLIDYGGAGSIENVSVSGTVLSDAENSDGIGGLVGFTSTSGPLEIAKVYADVDVTVTPDEESPGDNASDIGGLFGELEVFVTNSDEPFHTYATVHDVYSWGDVTAETGQNVGGLVGRIDIEHYEDENSSAFIELTRTYVRGDVTGLYDVGGLVGAVQEISNDSDDSFYEISSSFVMGKVSITSDLEGDTDYQGAIFGELDGPAYSSVTTEDLYFDQTRTGQTNCSNSYDDVEDCTAVNIDNSQPLYFINNTSNAPLNDWDFENVWVKNAGAPPTFEAYELGEDLNGDLIPDAEQDNISGYTSDISGKKVAIDVGDGCEITKDDLEHESALSVQDDEYEYDHGLFDFAGDCETSGFTTTITLYYYGVDPDGFVLRKYNPETQQYSTVEGASISQTTIYGASVTVVSYQLTDGGELDLDGEVDGAFEDPAGLARLVSSPDSGDNSDNGGSGGISSMLADTGFGATLLLIVATGLIVGGGFAIRNSRVRA